MGKTSAVRIAAAAAGVVLLTGTVPSFAAAQRLDEDGHYLGTKVAVTLCYGSADEDRARMAMDDVWRKFADIHARMNAFDPAGDVARLNAAGGRVIRVHDLVYRLLERSKEHARLTGGVFDITVKPLLDLWKQAGERQKVPSREEVLGALSLVGIQRLELLGRGRVRLPGSMKVDLGGNAAGFAADEAAAVLRSFGFPDFLIDAGGEIYAGGRACEGRPWRVGLQAPVHGGKPVGVVILEDRALSTSGSYEQYTRIAGQRWTHIINPVTGYPEQGVVRATVVAPAALEADVLSTALCVLGPAAGLRLIDGLGQGYAAAMTIENGAGALEEKATRSYAVFTEGKDPL